NNSSDKEDPVNNKDKEQDPVNKEDKEQDPVNNITNTLHPVSNSTSNKRYKCVKGNKGVNNNDTNNNDTNNNYTNNSDITPYDKGVNNNTLSYHRLHPLSLINLILLREQCLDIIIDSLDIYFNDSLKYLKYFILSPSSLHRFIDSIFIFNKICNNKIKEENKIYRGVINKESGEGVSDKKNRVEGVSDRSMLEGVNNEYDIKGVNTSTSNYKGVNDITSKQQGVNNVSDNQQGVNNTPDTLHPSNNTNTSIPLLSINYSSYVYDDLRRVLSIIERIPYSITIEGVLFKKILKTIKNNNNNSKGNDTYICFTYEDLNILSVIFRMSISKNKKRKLLKYWRISILKCLNRFKSFLSSCCDVLEDGGVFEIVVRFVCDLKGFKCLLEDILYLVLSYKVGGITNIRGSIGDIRNNNIDDYRGVNNSIEDYRGVNNNIDDYKGVNNSIEDYRGVNNSIDDYKGVSKSIVDYKGVNNKIHDYRGVNNSIDGYRGVNGNVHDYRGVSKSIVDYKGVNNNIVDYKGVNKSIEDYKGVNNNIEDYRGVNNNVHDYRGVNNNLHDYRGVTTSTSNYKDVNYNNPINNNLNNNTTTNTTNNPNLNNSDIPYSTINTPVTTYYNNTFNIHNRKPSDLFNIFKILMKNVFNKKGVNEERCSILLKGLSITGYSDIINKGVINRGSGLKYVRGVNNYINGSIKGVNVKGSVRVLSNITSIKGVNYISSIKRC
ncbi:hypothetical protein CWI38_1466p0030, partial [Hamiltosporidium tvaerminnensis]